MALGTLPEESTRTSPPAPDAEPPNNNEPSARTTRSHPEKPPEPNTERYPDVANDVSREPDSSKRPTEILLLGRPPVIDSR